MLSAKTLGGVESEKVNVEINVCRNNSLFAQSSIRQVIDRFSTNVPDRDLPNTHIIPHYKLKDLYNNGC